MFNQIKQWLSELLETLKSADREKRRKEAEIGRELLKQIEEEARGK